MILETTWFFLWGLLWAIYFMLDGYVLGAGMLMPFVAKTDKERRFIYNATGPFWDGNEVWLITAGGVTFAAFPKTYATLFSGFYLALLLLLFTLIFRGVTFEYRSKLPSELWRTIWDRVKAVCSFLPALLFGVAFANIFAGVPIDGNGVFQGNLFTLLNPYGILGGLVFVLAFLVHGALWLSLRAPRSIADNAGQIAGKLWWIYLALAVLFLGATAVATDLWANYFKYPLLMPIPLLAVVCLLLTKIMIGAGRMWTAWGCSAATIVLVTLFGVLGMYPALLPSSLDPNFSMTIANSASSPLTLKIMLGVALTFVPIVLVYQLWAYVTFGGRLTDEDLEHDEAY